MSATSSTTGSQCHLITERRDRKLQIMSVLAISIGHFIDGTVLGFTSPALPSINATTEATPNEQTFIKSSYAIGTILGCLIATPCSLLLGRRGTTLIVTSTSYFIGYVLIMLGFLEVSNTYFMVVLLDLGRIFTGIGLGVTLSVPMVYLVEIVHPSMVSTLGVVPNLFAQFGILVTYALGISLEWYQLALIFSFCCIPFWITVWFIPESPVYLMSKGKCQQAALVLDKLGHSEERFLQLQEKTQAERASGSLMSGSTLTQAIKLLTKPTTIKPFLTGVLLMIFFQGSGYPIVIGSAADIVSGVFQDLDPRKCAVVVGLAVVVGALASIPLSRACNRRALLIVSAIGVTMCHAIMGLYRYYEEDLSENYGWVLLLTLVSYICLFMIGYGSVSWVIAAEMLPLTSRSALYPLALAIMWGVNLFLTQTLTDLQRCNTFWTFACISFIGIIFIALFIPETKGKTAAEIEEYWSLGRSFRRFQGYGSTQRSTRTEIKAPI